jgi:hypothetical protein
MPPDRPFNGATLRRIRGNGPMLDLPCPWCPWFGSSTMQPQPDQLAFRAPSWLGTHARTQICGSQVNSAEWKDAQGPEVEPSQNTNSMATAPNGPQPPPTAPNRPQPPPPPQRPISATPLTLPL